MKVVPLPTADELHDRYMRHAAEFRAAPNDINAVRCAKAYERFYIAFTGGGVGLEEAMAGLLKNMRGELAKAGVAA